ncbi:MAG: DUF4430 domain-containing protein, partial [Oscillospiraceae bacterium]
CTATLSGYIPQSKVFNISKEEADGKLQKTIPISLVRENSNPSTTDKLLVKFTLLGDNLHETPESHKGNETWINKLSLLLPADSTVFDVFNKALNEKSFTFVEKSYSYIGSITTPKSMGENTLSEFANGPKSGWMYTVNGEYPMNGMRDEKLKDGDKILFYFTDDYTQEPPSFKWNTSGGSGGSGGGGSSRPTATATATPKPTAKVDLNSAIEDTANIVKANVKNPQVGSIGGEWAIIGLARSGASVPNEYYQKYYENVEKTVKTCGGVLDEKKYTEYSRVALALTAIGKDPKNVAGFNLLKPLGDYDKTVWQGINGAIWALIALDSGEYDIPQNTEAKVQATREMYVKYILDNQLSNGGFSLTGKEPADVDVTGMALQALNKYKAQNDVKNAMEKAVSALKKMQTNSGGFESFGVENIEGVSQVIVGINAMNMTADNADFTKNNNTLLDNLMSFYVEKSGFKHAKNDDKINQMATEQALYAMASAKRTIDKKPSLYNMSDVIKSDNDSSENGFGLIGKNPAIRLNKVIKAGKTFDDIRGHKNQKAIELLAERGVINGYSDSEFLPDLTMSRAEFATIIDRALGLELGGDKMFNDVADDAWYNMYVK